MAHDEIGCEVGDQVQLVESRPDLKAHQLGGREDREEGRKDRHGGCQC